MPAHDEDRSKVGRCALVKAPASTSNQAGFGVRTRNIAGSGQSHQFQNTHASQDDETTEKNSGDSPITHGRAKKGRFCDGRRAKPHNSFDPQERTGGEAYELNYQVLPRQRHAVGISKTPVGGRRHNKTFGRQKRSVGFLENHKQGHTVAPAEERQNVDRLKSDMEFLKEKVHEHASELKENELRLAYSERRRLEVIANLADVQRQHIETLEGKEHNALCMEKNVEKLKCKIDKLVGEIDCFEDLMTQEQEQHASAVAEEQQKVKCLEKEVHHLKQARAQMKRKERLEHHEVHLERHQATRLADEQKRAEHLEKELEKTKGDAEVMKREIEELESQLTNLEKLHVKSLADEQEKVAFLHGEVENLNNEIGQMGNESKCLGHHVVSPDKQYGLSLVDKQQMTEHLVREVECFKQEMRRMGDEIERLENLVAVAEHCHGKALDEERCKTERLKREHAAALAAERHEVKLLEKEVGRLEQYVFSATQEAEEAKRCERRSANKQKNYVRCAEQKASNIVKECKAKVMHMREKCVEVDHRRCTEVKGLRQEIAMLVAAQDEADRRKRLEMALLAEHHAAALAKEEQQTRELKQQSAMCLAEEERKRRALEQRHAAYLAEEHKKAAFLEERHASVLAKERQKTEDLEHRHAIAIEREREEVARLKHQLTVACESGSEEAARLRNKLRRSRQLSAELALTVGEIKRLTDQQSKFLAKRVEEMKHAKLGRRMKPKLWRESSDAQGKGGQGGGGGRLVMAPQVTVTIHEEDSLASSES
ncbi:unnamed protein product [Ascophyllum nodosum]